MALSLKAVMNIYCIHRAVLLKQTLTQICFSI